MRAAMSEEEVFEEVSEKAHESEEEVEEEAIDINAALLEAMVKRTEILEKYVKGEVGEAEATSMLSAVKVPTLGRRRRRK